MFAARRSLQRTALFPVFQGFGGTRGLRQPVPATNPATRLDEGGKLIAPLGTHIVDPAERLAFVYSQTSNSKAMSEAIGARNMTEMSKVSPALFMALGAQLYTRLGLANRGVAPPFTTVVTNVPGPPVPIHFAGARLESMMGLLCLTDGLGLGQVVQSYVDEATVAFTADRELMPDPDFTRRALKIVLPICSRLRTRRQPHLKRTLPHDASAPLGKQSVYDRSQDRSSKG